MIVAAAIADEKRLRDQADDEAKQANDWMQKAELAVRQDKDDLAKQALLGTLLAGDCGRAAQADARETAAATRTSTVT